MNRLKNNKLAYIILAVIIVLLVSVGITYALWIVTKSQTGENQISSACLKLELNNEANDITLSNQFPISDEAGMKSTPYTFTITNKCNTSLDYQVALESIGDEATALQASSLKVALNDSISLLSNKLSIDATIDGAYASNRLAYGTLAPKNNEGSSVTYNLRIWIDYYAPNSEQNKTFTSKISVTTGQNITNPYKKGTLAYNILSNYGGASAITEIDANKYTDIKKNVTTSYSDSYPFGTSYKYDESTGIYTLAGDIVSATFAECENGTKNCGKYTMFDYTSIYGVFEITNVDLSGRNPKITANYITYANKFGEGTIESDAGLYKALDDYGDSYYFRGNPENNYVEFGKWAEDVTLYWADGSTPEYYYSLEECESGNNHNAYGTSCNKITDYSGDKMYWRIVRINGDGTVRMIYDGINLVANGNYHNGTVHPVPYSYNINDIYTYTRSDSTQLDSSVKYYLDKWYELNLNDYSSYIADSIFCNDRTYESFNRLIITRSIPTLICKNKSDKYTVNDTQRGNGYLDYPVGLITADEVNLAGSTPLNGYLSYVMSLPSNINYLTSTESYYTATAHGSGVWQANVGDNLFNDFSANDSSLVLDGLNIRPVINLKSDVQFTGSGTLDDPYVIVTE